MPTAAPLQAAGFPDYPVKPANTYPSAVVQDQWGVAAEALPTLKEQEEYFRFDFSKVKCMPVLVVIENHSSSKRLLFKREDILVFFNQKQESQSGKIASGKSPTAVVLAGAATAGAFFSPAALAGAFVAMHVEGKAAEVRENIIKKELRSTTLSPGQSIHGFLYIPVPNGPFERGELRIRIPLTPAGEDSPVNLDVPL